jgi:hypothetical protein
MPNPPLNVQAEEASGLPRDGGMHEAEPLLLGCHGRWPG